MNGALPRLLVLADVALIIALVLALSIAGLTVVRRAQPSAAWMLLAAGGVELVALAIAQLVAPAALTAMESTFTTDPDFVFAIGPALQLVSDGLHAAAALLLLGVIVRLARKRG